MSGFVKLAKLYSSRHPFTFENGEMLESVDVAYETHGRLNAAGDNAILVCHALTGDAHVAGTGVYSDQLLASAPLLNGLKPGQPGWWDGMIGKGRTLDTSRYFIVCINILGSCYGTSGPASINPQNGLAYRMTFPHTSIRDIVRLQQRLLQELHVRQLVTVTGGSLGGMQVLEWAVMYPDMVSSIIPVATSVRHSDWCIGMNHLARDAIIRDPAWHQGNYVRQPEAGLALARKIAMVSYRSDRIFNSRFSRQRNAKNGRYITGNNHFQVESYLRYQGRKLVGRFDANSYLYLTRAMDEHDLSRDRGALEPLLASIKMPVLSIGIDSDILYPAHEQRDIAAMIPGSSYGEIKSPFGHDAFLVEFAQLDALFRNFFKLNKL